ncbi:MAG: DUF4132 domain-containing protein, partial [Clostridia bacterium]|nr:DUF4132 domain-containing protein [Clostridia bacterium]
MEKTEKEIAEKRRIAEEYAATVRARRNQADNEMKARTDALSAKSGFSSFGALFEKMMVEGKYSRPSEFFAAEMPWLCGKVILPRFYPAFLYTVDNVMRYPFTVGYERRPYRSLNIEAYSGTVMGILYDFSRDCVIDRPLSLILSRRLPEDEQAFLDIHSWEYDGYIWYALTYDLDTGDTDTLQAVETLLLGGDGQLITHELINGVLFSENEKAHSWVVRLLVAARLQDGLRQAICESADMGSEKGFRAVLDAINQNGLMRFSSVKRAAAVWTGLIGDNCYSVDRISDKLGELITAVLSSPEKRAEYLASEDAMKIHMALWGEAFHSVEAAVKTAKCIALNGTHHQILVCGYFLCSLRSAGLHLPLVPRLAAEVIMQHGDSEDILAVYLGCFDSAYSVARLHELNRTDRPEVSSIEDPIRFYQRLKQLHRDMKTKQKKFDPCIFPWHSVTLQKSDIAAQACAVALSFRDTELLNDAAELFTECSADDRLHLLPMLTFGKASEKRRQIYLNCICDRSEYVAKKASEEILKGGISPSEAIQIEGMLKFKSSTSRNAAMKLLLSLRDPEVAESISRLISDKSEEKRQAALEMITTVSLDPKRALLAEKLRASLHEYSPASQLEKTLLSKLIPSETEPQSRLTEESLCSPEDEYLPDISALPLAKLAAEYTEFFPDSHLEREINGGRPKQCHDPILASIGKRKDSLCESRKDAEKLLDSISALFDSHQSDTFVSHFGETCTLGGNAYAFSYVDQNGNRTIAAAELWENWYQSEVRDPARLLRAYVLLIGEGVKMWGDTSNWRICIDHAFGDGFFQLRECLYRHHVLLIFEYLLSRYADEVKLTRIASALAYWLAFCIPDERFHIEMNGNFGRGTRVFLTADPRIASILRGLKYTKAECALTALPCAEMLRHNLNAAVKRVCPEHKSETDGRISVYANSSVLTNDSEFIATTFDYFIGVHLGILSKKALYHFIFKEKRSGELTFLPHALKEDLARGGSDNAMRLLTRTDNAVKKYRVILDIVRSADGERLLALINEVCENAISVIFENELSRGDAPGKYSQYIRGISRIYGAERFVRILSAIGKDNILPSSSENRASRRWNLAHLLSVCQPSDCDDAAKLGDLLKNAEISDKRLVEAAMYSEGWMPLIGRVLRIEGFESACYYFIAHTAEQQYGDARKRREAKIAEFTPLSMDELADGAFDVNWFNDAYSRTGEKSFRMIYDAAKYISSGAMHTRAKKYADAVLGQLTVDEAEAAITDKRNKDTLMAYALIPQAGDVDTLRRYTFIQKFLKESKTFGAQRMASEKKASEMALRNLATSAGYEDKSRLTLRMESIAVAELSEYFVGREIDGALIRLSVDSEGKASVICERGGKSLKNVPASLKKDSFVIALEESKKMLTEQHRRATSMLEGAMELGSFFRADELLMLMKNPVIAPILRKLVFAQGERLGFPDGDSLVDADGLSHPLTDETLTVAHPFALYKSGKWGDFQRYAFEKKLVQPFRQIFRELYLKTADELGTYRSLRYAGNQIQPGKAAACLKRRGWIADVYDGLSRVYYTENIIAHIYALADWFSPSDIEAPTLEYVIFTARKTGEELKIDDIPDLIFSEVMRDVDLAVSVAHAGGVDPEASHSTVEMREAILSFSLPLLKLQNVRVENSHAFIEGTLASYTVHLGSGVVHQRGGSMINVLPVHSQHKG